MLSPRPRHCMISIHAPARGATNPSCLGEWYCMYFNPRSREGSDSYDKLCTHTIGISIHAPARGATVISSHDIINAIFQSTLPRGERPEQQAQSAREYHFNPRSREGSDVFLAHYLRRIIAYFNPRSREGSDLVASSVVSTRLAFQSTLPRGERLCPLGLSKRHYYFNPRSREGSDGGTTSTPSGSTTFQSTLPRGERRKVG